jgi:hypothetical protein
VRHQVHHLLTLSPASVHNAVAGLPYFFDSPEYLAVRLGQLAPCALIVLVLLWYVCFHSFYCTLRAGYSAVPR